MALDFGKLNFSTSFDPTAAFPIDARCYFESYELASAAAATAEEAGSSNTAYYYGQNIAVVESGKATLYVIQPDKTLKEVGSAPVGDGKSIEVTEDGKISVVGFGEAQEGQQLRIQDGKITWFTPDTTTVEGLSTTVAGHTSDINDLKQRMETAETDISSLESSVETLNGSGEGSVKKQVDDAINKFATDVSNDQVVNTFKELVDYVAEHGDAAASMAGDITELQELVGQTDVATQIQEALDSALKSDGEADKYALATELETVRSQLENKVDAEEGKQLSSNDFTDDLKSKLEGLNENGEANIIDNVKINGSALSIEEKAVDIPLATALKLGVVKSSDAENGVAVSADGSMSVNSVNVNKLVQTDGEWLVLDGGNSASK